MRHLPAALALVCCTLFVSCQTTRRAPAAQPARLASKPQPNRDGRTTPPSGKPTETDAFKISFRKVPGGKLQNGTFGMPFLGDMPVSIEQEHCEIVLKKSGVVAQWLVKKYYDASGQAFGLEYIRPGFKPIPRNVAALEEYCERRDQRILALAPSGFESLAGIILADIFQFTKVKDVNRILLYAVRLRRDNEVDGSINVRISKVDDVVIAIVVGKDAFPGTGHFGSGDSTRAIYNQRGEAIKVSNPISEE